MKSGTARVMRAVDEVCWSFCLSFPAEEEEEEEEEEPAILLSVDSVLVKSSIGFSAAKEEYHTVHCEVGGVDDPEM